METKTNYRLQIPVSVAAAVSAELRKKGISTKSAGDSSGLRSEMEIFSLVVATTSLVASGLTIYKILRDLRRRGQHFAVVVEATLPTGEAHHVKIDPGKAEPVIKLELGNLQLTIESAEKQKKSK
ncbi:hypothetical protein KC734_07635 [candidate division KSB1 bacterium]|nr:hypothetical protein [candidate division KSB1 bacterium]